MPNAKYRVHCETEDAYVITEFRSDAPDECPNSTEHVIKGRYGYRGMGVIPVDKEDAMADAIDGKREAVVDEKDRERLAKLRGQMNELRAALTANQQMFTFILQDYVEQGERMLDYSDETGALTVETGEKEEADG